MDLSRFQDVRFVCMGGSPVRAASFAQDLRAHFQPVDSPSPLEPIGKTERFSLYKVGPIISASHGIGMPSMLVLMHEVAKLLHYAGAKDVSYIRIGTSGGIGSEPGTIIVSSCGVMGTLEPVYEAIELGERRRYNADLDDGLANELVAAAKEIDIPVVSGKTLGTDDFYDAQGRLDGAFRAWYTEEDKMAFLKKAHAAGIRNIEMEAPAFCAFCHRAGIHGAIVCCSIVNRLKGDQIESTSEQLGQFSVDAQRVVIQHMNNALRGNQDVKKAKFS
jgi:uridine phosphorylase